MRQVEALHTSPRRFGPRDNTDVGSDVVVSPIKSAKRRSGSSFLPWYLPGSSAAREYGPGESELVYRVRLHNNRAHALAYWSSFLLCLVLQLVSLFFIRWCGWFFLPLAFRFGWYLDGYPHELRIVKSNGRRLLGVCFGINGPIMPIGTKEDILELSEARSHDLALSLGCSMNFGWTDLHNWAVEAGENTHVVVCFRNRGLFGGESNAYIVLTPDPHMGDRRVSAVDVAARIAAEMDLEKSYLEKNGAHKQYDADNGLKLAATRYNKSPDETKVRPASSSLAPARAATRKRPPPLQGLGDNSS